MNELVNNASMLWIFMIIPRIDYVQNLVKDYSQDKLSNSRLMVVYTGAIVSYVMFVAPHGKMETLISSVLKPLFIA